MKGRGPRPKPDAAREFDQRLHDRFQWIDGYAEVSGWWRDADLIASLGGAVAGLAEEEDVEVVLAPQSRGTLLGALVAQHLGVGLIELRKDVGAQADTDRWLRARTPLDYRARSLELAIRADLLAIGTRVPFVDEWVDTGGQLLAARTITALARAHWCGGAVIVDALTDPRLRHELSLRSLLHLRDL